MKPPVDYGLMSDEEILIARKKVANANGRCIPLHNKLGWAMLIAFGMGIAGIPLILCNGKLVPVVLGIEPVLLTAVVIFGLALLIVDACLKKQSILLEKLTPLSETTNCTLALHYVKRYPEAREVHSKAIDAGRQLYMFDYQEISRIAEQEEEKEIAVRSALEAEKQAKACRELHGFPALETA